MTLDQQNAALVAELTKIHHTIEQFQKIYCGRNFSQSKSIELLDKIKAQSLVAINNHGHKEVPPILK